MIETGPLEALAHRHDDCKDLNLKKLEDGKE